MSPPPHHRSCPGRTHFHLSSNCMTIIQHASSGTPARTTPPSCVGHAPKKQLKGQEQHRDHDGYDSIGLQGSGQRTEIVFASEDMVATDSQGV